MKKITFFALLALIPLYAFSGADRSDNVYGTWEDYYSGVSLKIKPSKRRGILVKRLDRHRHSNWIRYDRIGRNVYDDCNGNKIRLTRNGLKWSKRNGRKSFYLERVGRSTRNYDYSDRSRGYDNYEYAPRRGYITSSNLGGDWYCNAHDVHIEVGYRRDGIRVRRQNRRGGGREWYDYQRDDRNRRRYYDDNTGNYYELDGNNLVFRDNKNRKKLVFRRR